MHYATDYLNLLEIVIIMRNAFITAACFHCVHAKSHLMANHKFPYTIIIVPVSHASLLHFLVFI